MEFLREIIGWFLVLKYPFSKKLSGLLTRRSTSGYRYGSHSGFREDNYVFVTPFQGYILGEAPDDRVKTLP
jgi:hypothetical protein